MVLQVSPRGVQAAVTEEGHAARDGAIHRGAGVAGPAGERVGVVRPGALLHQRNHICRRRGLLQALQQVDHLGLLLDVLHLLDHLGGS